jgi:hypothetical protein
MGEQTIHGVCVHDWLPLCMCVCVMGWSVRVNIVLPMIATHPSIPVPSHAQNSRASACAAKSWRWPC